MNNIKVLESNHLSDAEFNRLNGYKFHIIVSETLQELKEKTKRGDQQLDKKTLYVYKEKVAEKDTIVIEAILPTNPVELQQAIKSKHGTLPYKFTLSSVSADVVNIDINYKIAIEAGGMETTVGDSKSSYDIGSMTVASFNAVNSMFTTLGNIHNNDDMCQFKRQYERSQDCAVDTSDDNPEFGGLPGNFAGLNLASHGYPHDAYLGLEDVLWEKPLFRESLLKNKDVIINFCRTNAISLLEIPAIEDCVLRVRILTELIELAEQGLLNSSSVNGVEKWIREFYSVINKSQGQVAAYYNKHNLTIADQFLNKNVNYKELFVIADMETLLNNSPIKPNIFLSSTVTFNAGVNIDQVTKEILAKLNDKSCDTIFIPTLCNGHWFYLLGKYTSNTSDNHWKWTIQDSQPNVRGGVLTQIQKSIENASNTFLNSSHKCASTV